MAESHPAATFKDCCSSFPLQTPGDTTADCIEMAVPHLEAPVSPRPSSTTQLLICWYDIPNSQNTQESTGPLINLPHDSAEFPLGSSSLAYNLPCLSLGNSNNFSITAESTPRIIRQDNLDNALVQISPFPFARSSGQISHSDTPTAVKLFSLSCTSQTGSHSATYSTDQEADSSPASNIDDYSAGTSGAIIIERITPLLPEGSHISSSETSEDPSLDRPSSRLLDDSTLYVDPASTIQDLTAHVNAYSVSRQGTQDQQPSHIEPLSPTPTVLPSKRDREDASDDDIRGADSVKRTRLPSNATPLRLVSDKTAAAHARAFKKLSTPFRSPVAKPPQAQKRSSFSMTNGPSFKKPAVISRLVKKTADTAVTAPFRPPVKISSSLSAPSTLTIQALERRVQMLKRAIKIKADNGDVELERLARKWGDAARAASWDLWMLVKDGSTASGGESWGWANSDKSKPFDDWNDRPGWSDDPSSEVSHEAEDVPDAECESTENTLGTMLAELGIAPTTLGWDEEEGEFTATT